MAGDEYWSRMLRAFRRREGLSQAALADYLRVDQTTVSRWERQQDMPSLRMRRILRDLLRRSAANRQDRALRLRVRQGFSPATLLGRGAVFLEANPAALREARLALADLRGSSIYGNFGQAADRVTASWESRGLFDGELALAMSVVTLTAAGRDAVTHIKTLDSPYFTADGEIWCVSELKRISPAEYGEFHKANNGPILAVPFDSAG